MTDSKPDGMAQHDWDALTDTVQRLREAGYRPTDFHDGEGWWRLPRYNVPLESVCLTDSARVVFTADNGTTNWVYFVWGNGPGETITDYTSQRDAFSATMDQIIDDNIDMMGE